MYRKLRTGLVVGLLAFAFTSQAYADEDFKGISRVELEIEPTIIPHTRVGEEVIQIEIEENDGYYYDYYEFEGTGFEWNVNDVPQVTIYLRADDTHEFALTKASEVRLKGGTYVTAKKQDDSKTLAVTVQFPPLTEYVEELSVVELFDDGTASWTAPVGAGSYELRLYRNGQGVGATYITTQDVEYDFSSKFIGEGNYHVKIRPINAENPTNKGEWVESEQINISLERANAIRSGEVAKTRQPKGEWMHDGIGWWYKFMSGEYVTDQWYQIQNQWYLFDEQGYMKTGWIDWDGKRYYLDTETGAMLMNTTTPDGTILDFNGNPKND